MSKASSQRAGKADPERLRADLRNLEDLPSPPRVLQEIMQVLGSDGSSAECLSEAVEKDVALTAKLLRLANSAYFGLPHPVQEVRAACVVLGFEMVRALAVGVSALDALTIGAGRALDLNAFWRHSVGTGTAAQMLARGLRLPHAGTAFCAGILHDLGKLVLATLSPDRYAGLADGPESTWRARETAEFGGDHEAAGGWVADDWSFPEELRSAIRSHHEPWEADGVNRWGALLHIADRVAARNGCPSVPAIGPAPPEAPDPRAVEVLAVPADLLTGVEARFATELERVESFVDMARG